MCNVIFLYRREKNYIRNLLYVCYLPITLTITDHIFDLINETIRQCLGVGVDEDGSMHGSISVSKNHTAVRNPTSCIDTF